MGIGDLLDTEIVHCFQVHFRFGNLELRDGNLTVIDGQERDQLFEICNFLVCYLNAGLKI